MRCEMSRRREEEEGEVGLVVTDRRGRGRRRER
jgi:hypothetical protein